MRSAHRYISSLLLAAVLAAPVAVMATPASNDDGVQVRVYDSRHKDYHNWDDHENKSWGVYLTKNHKKDHEFAKSSKREQSNYWNWRHAHPDHD
jgi:Ni/Co efflux regulator RcnB